MPTDTKPRPGRPALPADEKRQPHMVRFSCAEWEAIRRKAGGMPVSEWLRRLALESD